MKLVRVTSNGKTRNYIAFVAETLDSDVNAAICLQAVGPSIAKAIAITEVVKTLVAGIHQVNELSTVVSNAGCAESDEAIECGDKVQSGEFEDEQMDEDSKNKTRTKSQIQISLSRTLSALGDNAAQHYGYQCPISPIAAGSQP